MFLTSIQCIVNLIYFVWFTMLTSEIKPNYFNYLLY